MLEGETEAHLIGSSFIENKAGENGGHIRVAASSLVLHGKGTTLAWAPSKPAFPNAVVLGHDKYALFTTGKGCESHEGYVSLKTHEECGEAAFLLGLTALNGKVQDYNTEWLDQHEKANQIAREKQKKLEEMPSLQ